MPMQMRQLQRQRRYKHCLFSVQFCYFSPSLNPGSGSDTTNNLGSSKKHQTFADRAYKKNLIPLVQQWFVEAAYAPGSWLDLKRLSTQRDGPARLLPGLAGADLIFQQIGMLKYVLCYGGPAEHWDLLPASRLASKEILIEQNIKADRAITLCTLQLCTQNLSRMSRCPQCLHAQEDHWHHQERGR